MAALRITGLAGEPRDVPSQAIAALAQSLEGSMLFPGVRATVTTRQGTLKDAQKVRQNRAHSRWCALSL